MSDVRKEGEAVKARAALRGGVSSALFERSVADALEAQAQAQATQEAIETAQGEPPVQAFAPAERKRPLLRRIARRVLRGLRPLALPILHRFHLRVTHAVETSPVIQQQGVLLQDVRGFLTHTRCELLHALSMQDKANSVSERLERQEEYLTGLRRLAIANLQAVVALSEAVSESERDPGPLPEMAVLLARSSEGLAVLQKSVDENALVMNAISDAHRETASERTALMGDLHALQRQQSEQRGLIEQILRSRIVPLGEEVLVRTSFGWLLVPSDDHAIITMMGETGDALEPGTVHVIRSILQPGDLAVDVGTNVGALLLPMAERVGTDGMLIACEPSPSCSRALRKTAVLNGLEPRLALHQVAIGSADGVATLYFGSNSSLNSIVQLPDSIGTAEVQIKRLDDLVPSDRSPSLVKIDVEGMELEVLRGMRGVLGRSPDIALIAEFGPTHLSRIGIRPEDWLAEFESFGFTLWMIDEKGGGLIRASVENLRHVYSANILMVRQDLERWPQLKVVS